MANHPELPLRILLLCNEESNDADTISDHIGAFLRYSRHEVRRFNPRPGRHLCSVDLKAFDVVVLHYSLCVTLDSYLPPTYRDAVREFDGLKVQFIQDDYREVDAFGAAMCDLGIHVLFTLYPSGLTERVWRRYGGIAPLGIHSTLAGYVPEKLVGCETPPLSARPLDVVYRGRQLPFWLGRLAQEKKAIAEGFVSRAEGRLRFDVGWKESDRVYGTSWVEFLTSGRASLGTESGASITDFDGAAEKATRRYLEDRPDATFEEVLEKVLAPWEGNVVINVVSPRIFEAAALRTALVCFPGEYSGVVEAEKHYIRLEKDFSNFEEVVEQLKDHRRLEGMAERTYEDLVASGRYSYETFVRGFDEIVDKSWEQLGAKRKRLGGGERIATGIRLAVAPVLDPRRVYWRPMFLLLRRLWSTVRSLMWVTVFFVRGLGVPAGRSLVAASLTRFPSGFLAATKLAGLAAYGPRAGALIGGETNSFQTVDEAISWVAPRNATGAVRLTWRRAQSCNAFAPAEARVHLPLAFLERFPELSKALLERILHE